MNLMSSPNCHLRFSIVVLETLNFEWQCSQCLGLNLTCAQGVVIELLARKIKARTSRLSLGMRINSTPVSVESIVILPYPQALVINAWLIVTDN